MGPTSLMDDAALIRRGGFSKQQIHDVELALREMWGLLVADRAWSEKALSVFNERQISEAIVLKFDEIIKDEAKWNEHPVLEKLNETVDPFPVYDAKNTSRRKVRDGQSKFDTIPDFYFRRRTMPGRSPMSNGLFIEAKIVDEKKNMGNYCGKGLMRYVKSLYAWDMPQAMMLAYVRDSGCALPKSLADHLRRHGKRSEYYLQGQVVAFPLSQFESRMYLSEHGRPDAHPETGEPCGNIVVYHLWMRV